MVRTGSLAVGRHPLKVQKNDTTPQKMAQRFPPQPNEAACTVTRSPAQLSACVSEHDRRALRAGLRAARDAEPYLKAAHPALVSNSTLEPVHLSDSEWTVLTPPRKQEEGRGDESWTYVRLPETGTMADADLFNAKGRIVVSRLPLLPFGTIGAAPVSASV